MAQSQKGKEAIASSGILADPHRNDLMAFAMSIVSNNEANFNLFGEWICSKADLPACPVCQTPMKHRDSRRRHIRREGGQKYWGVIRRLFCKKCRRLHNELPANVSPHKHYEVEVIEGVVDGVVEPDDQENEGYPCEVTMQRWKQWIEHNRSFIEGYIRSIGYLLLGLGLEFLKSEESILDYLREKYCDKEHQWLTAINRVVYNTGASLEAWPPRAP